MKPTDALYQSLESAYEHFNQSLFSGTLPDVIFTVQRQKGVLGYFAPDRWTSIEGKQCHEIAINPTHIGKSRIIDVLETLVHEMVHCWQYCFGKPGRRMYHNIEWAEKTLKSANFSVDASFIPGDPEQVVTRAIAEREADLLIMGAYSHSPWQSLFLGSRTNDLLRASLVPTITLHL